MPLRSRPEESSSSPDRIRLNSGQTEPSIAQVQDMHPELFASQSFINSIYGAIEANLVSFKNRLENFDEDEAQKINAFLDGIKEAAAAKLETAQLDHHVAFKAPLKPKAPDYDVEATVGLTDDCQAQIDGLFEDEKALLSRLSRYIKYLDLLFRRTENRILKAGEAQDRVLDTATEMNDRCRAFANLTGILVEADFGFDKEVDVEAVLRDIHASIDLQSLPGSKRQALHALEGDLRGLGKKLKDAKTKHSSAKDREDKSEERYDEALTLLMNFIDSYPAASAEFPKVTMNDVNELEADTSPSVPPLSSKLNVALGTKQEVAVPVHNGDLAKELEEKRKAAEAANKPPSFWESTRNRVVATLLLAYAGGATINGVWEANEIKRSRDEVIAYLKDQKVSDHRLAIVRQAKDKQAIFEASMTSVDSLATSYDADNEVMIVAQSTHAEQIGWILYPDVANVELVVHSSTRADSGPFIADAEVFCDPTLVTPKYNIRPDSGDAFSWYVPDAEIAKHCAAAGIENVTEIRVKLSPEEIRLLVELTDQDPEGSDGIELPADCEIVPPSLDEVRKEIDLVYNAFLCEYMIPEDSPEPNLHEAQSMTELEDKLIEIVGSAAFVADEVGDGVVFRVQADVKHVLEFMYGPGAVAGVTGLEDYRKDEGSSVIPEFDVDRTKLCDGYRVGMVIQTDVLDPEKKHFREVGISDLRQRLCNQG